MAKKVLVVEIDLTDAGDVWTVTIEKAQLLLEPSFEKQVITKRSTREKLICLPEPGEANSFIKAVYVETHET